MAKKKSNAFVPMANATKKCVVKIENQPKPSLKPISGMEFILMVKKHPCLYDRSHREFGKPGPSLHAWNSLAEQTGRRANSLKARLTKILKANENGAADSIELVRLLNNNRRGLSSSRMKRLSREVKPKSILKSNAMVPMSSAILGKKVRFIREEDTNNNFDNDETDEQFFDFIKLKLSKLSIAQRSELKAFVKAKISEYFLSLGQ